MTSFSNSCGCCLLLKAELPPSLFIRLTAEDCCCLWSLSLRRQKNAIPPAIRAVPATAPTTAPAMTPPEVELDDCDDVSAGLLLLLTGLLPPVTAAWAKRLVGADGTLKCLLNMVSRAALELHPPLGAVTVALPEGLEKVVSDLFSERNGRSYPPPITLYICGLTRYGLVLLGS